MADTKVIIALRVRGTGLVSPNLSFWKTLMVAVWGHRAFFFKKKWWCRWWILMTWNIWNDSFKRKETAAVQSRVWWRMAGFEWWSSGKLYIMCGSRGAQSLVGRMVAWAQWRFIILCFFVSEFFFMNSTVVSTCAQYLYQKNKKLDWCAAVCLFRKEWNSVSLFICLQSFGLAYVL